MPSSPGPNDYTRTPKRFVYRGLWLGPQDLVPDGKVAYCQNIRSTQDGTIQPRFGLCQVNDSSFGDPIHSIFRLNDTTPGATNPDVTQATIGSTICVPSSYSTASPGGGST